ncbi:hypothetical protein E2C01_041941 [Portunus trituberculatus]|uniref:Uncharacterized protein n=1 Tax=Portunus trituberculatus TaxID=210409 RepID=A0A5B7FT11_PORTR|nr:hypothetical protein [Portunus trituberculatus]
MNKVMLDLRDATRETNPKKRQLHLPPSLFPSPKLWLSTKSNVLVLKSGHDHNSGWRELDSPDNLNSAAPATFRLFIFTVRQPIRGHKTLVRCGFRGSVPPPVSSVAVGHLLQSAVSYRNAFPIAIIGGEEERHGSRSALNWLLNIPGIGSLAPSSSSPPVSSSPSHSSPAHGHVPPSG